MVSAPEELTNVTSTPESVSAPEQNGTPAETPSLRDQFIAEEKANMGILTEEKPTGEETPSAEATPEVELEPLDENLERFPKAKALYEQARTDPEAWQEFKDYQAEQLAAVHNQYTEFQQSVDQRAEEVIGTVNGSTAVMERLIDALGRHQAGAANAKEVADLINGEAKEAFTALLPHNVNAKVDEQLKAQRTQIQEEAFNAGVVYSLYEPVKGLKNAALTKEVTDLLRKTPKDADEKAQIPAQIVAAVHEAGIKEGIRRGEAAFGRQKSVADNKDAGPSAVVGSAPGGRSDKDLLMDPNTPIETIRAIRERQLRSR